jgi:hypothetical protein
MYNREMFVDYIVHKVFNEVYKSPIAPELWNMLVTTILGTDRTYSVIKNTHRDALVESFNDI